MAWRKRKRIFPDPASQTLVDGWRTGIVKALERRINAIVLEGAQIDPRDRLTRTAITSRVAAVQQKQFVRSIHE
jgi:hypothetical protein